ncbi:MAG: cytochrome family [Thermoleophilaceae bacterium]|nr:cytochrome family [Thermoleophilaceae bacterium]
MSLPPGPRVPGALQTAAFMRRPIDFLLRCQARYGDCFRARFQGIGQVVYVADPADVERVYKGPADVFHAGEANAALFAPLIGRLSVMTLDGKEHLRQRKLLLPPFHGDSMRRFESVFAEVAAREVERWPVGEPFEMYPAMKRVTMEVILRAVIGVRDEARLVELAAAVTRLDRIAPVVLPLPILQRDLGRLSPWARMVAAREALDRLVYREIAERREAAGGDADDVLSLLVAARHDDGSPMSDRQLRDEVYDLLAAGFETSSASLAWTFERVLRAPAVLERLREEPGDDEYLEAVVKETLRVRPPVTDSTRLLKREAEVAGHLLPAGTQVVVALPLLHLRPSVWSDPFEFRPGRWLEGGEGGQPYTFIPFGGGVRRCIGAAFAMLEMKVMLRTVLERARLRAAWPEDEAQRLHHVVVVPARGAKVVLDERPASRAAAPAAATPAAAAAAGRG